MARRQSTGALYWDASGLVSLFKVDAHTAAAKALAAGSGPHLCSTVSHAELCAVLGRLERLGDLGAAVVDRAFRTVTGRRFKFEPKLPSFAIVEDLSRRHSLRGADLWHLALLVELRTDVRWLRLVSFDEALASAAVREGIALAR